MTDAAKLAIDFIDKPLQEIGFLQGLFFYINAITTVCYETHRLQGSCKGGASCKGFTIFSIAYRFLQGKAAFRNRVGISMGCKVGSLKKG